MAEAHTYPAVTPRRQAAPPIPAASVPRPRVLEVLNGAHDATVICLQAPGGYGKTTALAQWVAQDSRPTIWLGVRPATADPAWLAQSLLDALDDSGLMSHGTAPAASTSEPTWHLSVLPELEAAVAAVREPIVVVVDDAGTVEGRSA